MMDRLTKNHVYIYALKDPRNGEIRYIGKTINIEMRLKEHIRKRHLNKTYRDKWIISLMKTGVSPIIEVIEICSESMWADRERFWISEYRKSFPKLTNVAEGGEGVSADIRKRQWTPERRKIAAERIVAINKSRIGYKHTEEFRRAQSERQKKRFTAEYLVQRSAEMKAAWARPGHREKMAELARQAAARRRAA